MVFANPPCPLILNTRFSHMGTNRRVYGQSVKASRRYHGIELYPYLPPSRSISPFQAACRLLRHQRNKSYLTEPTDISRTCGFCVK